MKHRIATSVAIAAALALGVAACQQKHHHITHASVTAHHLRDGRYAYEDAAGHWWVYTFTNGSTTGGALSDSGSWQPLAQAIDLDDVVEDVTTQVATVDGGAAPLSEAQAVSEVQVEAGGGTSEASAGPTDSSPSVSSDAGGGGDVGGSE